MTFHDAQLERDLQHKDTNDSALSRVLRAKRDISRVESSALFNEEGSKGFGEMYEYYAALLQDVPAETRCACCGVEIVNVFHRDGFVLGEECRLHSLGACRKL